MYSLNITKIYILEVHFCPKLFARFIAVYTVCNESLK